MGFANPGALGVGKHNRDSVPVGLECVDEVEDVGGGLGAWWAIVVDYEDVHFGRLQRVSFASCSDVKEVWRGRTI